MWTIHESRALEMECFMYNIKVVGEMCPGTKISKEHKKNPYERKSTFNHLPEPRHETYPTKSEALYYLNMLPIMFKITARN